MPIQDLSRNLESLSIHFAGPTYIDATVDLTDIEEQTEREAASIEESAFDEFVLEDEVIDAVNLAIATRTIIAAARGNRLTSLQCEKTSIQHPFAIRSLLPYWIKISDWSESDIGAEGWMEAACTLRPLLSHASFWLGTTSDSGARDALQLTREEVQSLRSYFDIFEIPKPDWQGSHCPLQVKRYLPWLSEDADLAQQVADSWNSVVESREATDIPLCKCLKCDEQWRETLTNRRAQRKKSQAA